MKDLKEIIIILCITIGMTAVLGILIWAAWFISSFFGDWQPLVFMFTFPVILWWFSTLPNR